MSNSQKIMAILPTILRDSKLSKGILLGLFCCVFLLVILLSWQGAKTWSYSKLTPYKVEFSLLAPQDIILNVQYDYGYGFAHGHVRPLRISGNSEFQKIAMSISAWKKVKNLRFSSPDETLDVTVKSLQVNLNGDDLLSRAVFSQAALVQGDHKTSDGEASLRDGTSLREDTSQPSENISLPFIVRNIGHRVGH